MPRPYSDDLRTKIISSLKNGNKQFEVAENFGVSTSFVSSLWERYNKNGNVKPNKIGGYVEPKVTHEGGEHLSEWIANNPSATLKELTEQYSEHFNIEISVSSIDRALKRIKLTYKKKAHTIQKKKVHEYRN